MVRNRVRILFMLLAWSCMPMLASAGVMDDLLQEDESLYCGVERYEVAYETSCLWNGAARAAGNCNAPQYQEEVGKREIYRRCRTLFVLGDGPPLSPVAPPDAPASVKSIWTLLKAIQPLAAKAVALPTPACFSGIKPYAQRTQKADHVYFFSCMSERDQAVLRQLDQSNAGKIVKAVENKLKTANTQSPETSGAAGELALLLEDEGSKAGQQAVAELLARFK